MKKGLHDAWSDLEFASVQPMPLSLFQQFPVECVITDLIIILLRFVWYLLYTSPFLFGVLFRTLSLWIMLFLSENSEV